MSDNEVWQAMNGDITTSESYRKAERLLAEAMGVGSGLPIDFGDLCVSPDGRWVAATGTVMERLEGLPQQRICLIDLESGTLEQLTQGDHRDRLPRWSPDGTRLAFLSDARKAYDFQLRILALADRSVVDAVVLDRWVEGVQWSHDGASILLLTAGLGADLAGAQGAVSAPVDQSSGPDWAPRIDLGVAETQWRSLWIYELSSGESRQVSPPRVNIWEGCWCGPAHLACIASDGPSEDDWYEADLRMVDIATGEAWVVHQPRDQIGAISASPGGRIAVVEAICSDRLLTAGTLLIGNGEGLASVDTRGVDVTFSAWQGEEALLLAGLRGFETVLGLVDPAIGLTQEIWVSSEKTFGNALFPDAAPMAAAGSAVIMAEGYLSPPELIVIEKSGARSIAFGRPVLTERIDPAATVERVEWSAADGLTIQGWLVRPGGDGPAPVVMQIHGGPVWRSRPRYVGRGLQALLLAEGYAIFQPNPRGSSGQGQDYARAVFGDVGGADAQDLLTGLDHLVARCWVDPERIGLFGGSYGGYMVAWLVTQDQRFAAAVPVAPVSDWVSAKFTSHVGRSIEMMLGGEARDSGSLYQARSPIFHAPFATTPTLTICGALDRSTPPVQGEELHHALTKAGATSVLLTYPGEGHGVRSYPAVIDYSARIMNWFALHMAPDRVKIGVE